MKRKTRLVKKVVRGTFRLADRIDENTAAGYTAKNDLYDAAEQFATAYITADIVAHNQELMTETPVYQDTKEAVEREVMAYFAQRFDTGDDDD